MVPDRQLGLCSDLSVEFAAGLDIQGPIVEDGHFLVASEPGWQPRLAAVLRAARSGE